MCWVCKSGGRGNHADVALKRRQSIICESCGKTFTVIKSDHRLRQGIKIRFCSKACEGYARRRADSYKTAVCAQCGQQFMKRADHFKELNFCSRKCLAKNRAKPDARWKDPSQIRVYHRDYRSRNREYINELARKWGIENRDKRTEIMRIRRAGAKCTSKASLADWKDVLAQYGGKCAHCGSSEMIECDHKIALSVGGKHVKENLQPLCRRCNASKGAGLVPKT